MADIADIYTAAADRYEKMTYNRVGRSGLKFPAVSLGLWHNFGSKDNYDNMKAMCRTAFDNGITQFDVANNYGPVYGSAEKSLGRILKDDFMPYRDELVIATKAGYDMWDGPYGDGGSRKYLMASLDQSLKRLGLDYVDVFYHHRMIRIHHWKRRWMLLPILCAVEKHCMQAYQIITKNIQNGR